MIPKFRAWLKKEQKMDNEIDHISWLDDELYCIGDGITYMVLAEDLVLMQSTGLKDKNGKEIFEGDIVSLYSVARVIKKNNLLGFYIEEGEKIGYFSDIVDVDCLEFFVKDFGEVAEILGNIYENPELLEVE